MNEVFAWITFKTYSDMLEVVGVSCEIQLMSTYVGVTEDLKAISHAVWSIAWYLAFAHRKTAKKSPIRHSLVWILDEYFRYCFALQNGTEPRLADDVSLDLLAIRTDGYTGADLAGLVRQASVKAFKESLTTDSDDSDDIKVTMMNFMEALKETKPSVSAEVRTFLLKVFFLRFFFVKNMFLGFSRRKLITKTFGSSIRRNRGRTVAIME